MNGDLYFGGGARKEYPVKIDGAAAGTLDVAADGLFTVFEASIPGHGGFVRLSVYGGGREGYLGVMQPWSGGLYLRRRFTRRECAGLPSQIEYAAPSGAADTVRENAAEEHTDDAAPAPAGNPAAEAAPSTVALPIPDGAEDLLWFARPDGTLTAFDGRGCIVAIPAQLRRRAPGAVLRRIGGSVYMLFRY